MQRLSIINLFSHSWIDSILMLQHMRQITTLSVERSGGEKTLVAVDPRICWSDVNGMLIRTAAWSL